ncbi:MAG TPA: TonB family protein, partial [Ramlibacter sp.]|nr:TonB family protein [Ramlibacter sp.]
TIASQATLEASPPRPRPVALKPPTPAPVARRAPQRPVLAAETPARAAESPAAAVSPAAVSTANAAPSSVAVAAAAPATPAAPAQSEPRFDADYLDNPAPAYPALSRRLGEEGKVVLRVFVRADGRPDAVEVKAGSGSPRLDEAAVHAVHRWKFVPARRGAEAVGAWVLVPIAFHLRG